MAAAPRRARSASSRVPGDQEGPLRMKRLIAVLIAVALCAALAVPALGATKTVKVGPKTRFGARSLTIKRGDTVRFRWIGGLPHNVRISKGPQRGAINARRKKGNPP